MPSMQHVFISMCIIISDVTLKLSVTLLSSLINGIDVTIGCVTALVMLLATANLILTWKYPDSIEDNNDTGGDFKFNLFEMLFLVLTNLPHNVSLIIRNISLRIAINKCVTYFIFAIGLSIMTGMLVVHQSDATAYDWMNHIDNEDVSDSTFRCQNLCNVTNAFYNMQTALKNDPSPWANLIKSDPDVSEEFSGLNSSQIFGKLECFGINNETKNSVYEYISIKKDLNCSKLLLNSRQLLIWIGTTWGVLAFCIVQAICEYKKIGFFVKLHNMIIINEDVDCVDPVMIL